MSKLDNAFFKIQSSKYFNLSKIPSGVNAIFENQDEYQSLLTKNQQRIEDFQNLLFASHTKGLIIVFQGMDSSGKDGAIKHVMSGVNPQGCSVMSFKTPTKNELAHDFLWRSNQHLPEKGEIKIFNRSYYEEVLITKVHPELLKNESLPNKIIDSQFWHKRYSDIVHHENYLHRQGFEIIKIFIHISKAEQKARLLARFDNPKKHWKISDADVKERLFWKNYQTAYDDCIRATASEHAPWYVVPGDDKKTARLSISQILVERFIQMNLSYPKLSSAEIKGLSKLRRKLLES